MKVLRKIVKIVAPKSFNDGLASCNNLAKKLISQKGIERYLDVGCGDGKLTMEFAEIVKPKEIYGLEFVDEFIKEAANKGIHVFKRDLNSGFGLEDNFFDLISSSQNIEHLHNTRLYLEECYRCLRWGGN